MQYWCLKEPSCPKKPYLMIYSLIIWRYNNNNQWWYTMRTISNTADIAIRLCISHVMHLFALNQVLFWMLWPVSVVLIVPTVAWQQTQRAVEHIQQLQRGRAWRQALRAMTLHFLTRPLLSLSLYPLLPFLGLLPIDHRGGRVHNPNNRRTGVGEENEGKEGKMKGNVRVEVEERQKKKAGHSHWEWMDRGAKIDGEAEVVHVLWTRWPEAPSVSLKPTTARSTSGPFMSVTAGFPVQTRSHSQHYCYGKMKAFPENDTLLCFPL